MQWVYLGVACFVGLLIILFFLAPMPEITDADMGVQETEIGDYDPGPFWKQINLFLAVWSQFCYVGAQVAVAVRSTLPKTTPPLPQKKLHSSAHTHRSRL